MTYLEKYPDTDRVKIVKKSILTSWDKASYQEHREMYLNQLIKAAIDDYIDNQIEILTHMTC